MKNKTIKIFTIKFTHPKIFHWVKTLSSNFELVINLPLLRLCANLFPLKTSWLHNKKLIKRFSIRYLKVPEHSVLAWMLAHHLSHDVKQWQINNHLFCSTCARCEFINILLHKQFIGFELLKRFCRTFQKQNMDYLHFFLIWDTEYFCCVNFDHSSSFLNYYDGFTAQHY